MFLCRRECPTDRRSFRMRAGEETADEGLQLCQRETIHGWDGTREWRARLREVPNLDQNLEALRGQSPDPSSLLHPSLSPPSNHHPIASSIMQLFLKSQYTAVVDIDDLIALAHEAVRLSHIPTESLSLSSRGRLLLSPQDFSTLTKDDTIHAVHRMSGGAPKKRCEHKDCSVPALRNLNCSLCAGQFCSKHRLLEQHACSGLASCKDELRRANQVKLESERCVAPKVV